MTSSILFQPFQLGHLTLKNRLTVPAMLTEYANADGSLSERYIRYYVERARGGFAMIVTEDNAVTPTGGGFPNLPGIWCDEFLNGHKELVRRVHAHDAKILVQLYHAGREASSSVTRVPCIAPSPIPDPVIGEIPHEMTRKEIHAMIKSFIAAANRAQESGYDGVELHAAHGYLLNQFLSPFSNRRLDEYGGTEENRLRMLLEIIAGIRKQSGPDFIINCKLSVDEFVEGGLTLRDSQRIAKKLEAAGINGLTASGGVYKSGFRTSAPYYCPSGCFAHLSAGLKAAVSIPIIAINRINTAEVAEQILHNQEADLLAIGRASIADPEFPIKIKQGRRSEIIPCIACDQGCQGRIAKGLPVSCLVNPRTGREADSDGAAVTHPRRVVIAGGGIAGMQAALVAARKGHHVELFERDERLGGFWNQAAIPPCKEIFNSFTLYLQNELAKTSVKIHLKTELTTEKIEEMHPDALICATGGESKTPALPGIDSHPNVVLAVDLLCCRKPFGKEIVVIGGGMVGAETAEHLAVHNCNVTILARSQIAKDMFFMTKVYLLESLKENGVALHEFCDIVKIESNRVVWRSRVSGEERSAAADQIVIAMGAAPRNGLKLWAEEHSLPSYAIGDADHVEDGVKAVLDGYEAALQIN